MKIKCRMLLAVEMYLQFACCAAVPGGGRNKEYALHLLHMCKGNIRVRYFFSLSMTRINISKFFTIFRIFSIILYFRNKIVFIVCDTLDIDISDIYVYVYLF